MFKANNKNSIKKYKSLFGVNNFVHVFTTENIFEKEQEFLKM